MARKGMPRRFGVAKRRTFVALVEQGLRRTAAAKQVGVSYQTIWRHLQSDEAFATAVDEAEMHVDDQVVDALFEAATGGNVVACQVWLYNRRPEVWADRRHQKLEHTVATDETADASHALDGKILSMTPPAGDDAAADPSE